MRGVSAEQVLAMKPPGWLVRPFPAGHGGFKMISPGRMPGARGVIGWYEGGRPGLRTFAEKPAPREFVLNSALEQPMLVEVLAAWARPADSAGAAVSTIPMLSAVTQQLVRDDALRVYEDPLLGDELRLLDRRDALEAVADPLNWWRDEADARVPAAASVIVLDATATGRAVLAVGSPAGATQSFARDQ